MDRDPVIAALPVPAARVELAPSGALTVRCVSRALVEWADLPTDGDLLDARLSVLLPDRDAQTKIRNAIWRGDQLPVVIAADCRVLDGVRKVRVAVGALGAAEGGGTVRPLAPHSDVVTVLLVLTPEDDSPAHAAEEALRGSTKRLQDMADNVAALMYIKHVDGRYTFINKHYEMVLGINRALVVGKTDFDLWPAPIASIYRADDTAVQESKRAMEFEEPIPRNVSGWGMWLSLKFPVFDPDGTLYGVGGISTDISERSRAEVAIRQARDEAERANKAKSDFLSRVSHELRTPLNSILGFGQLLRLESLSEDAEQYTQRILSAGGHLLSLINEVLEISRIEAGEARFSIETIAVCSPLAEAVELVRPLALEREVELARDFHGGLDTYVLADYQRLKQVVLNVLMNAVKYNRPGGMVTITLETTADRVRIRVMDTGLGMDPSDVERIFLPFERLVSDPADPDEGTGLGLALARSMISMMGGTLGVERTVRGRGSVFYIELPTASEPDGTNPEPEAASEPVVREVDLGGRRILYIEDNPTNLELVRRVLDRGGVPRLTTALDGATGVDLAVAHRPDLILLDLQLPDMDGEEVLARLHERRETRDIPIVVLSADAVPAQEQRLLRAGASAYVTKPFDIDGLLTVLDDVLHKEGT